MIADIMASKKFQSIIKKLFIRSYFSVPKEVRLNCTHYVIMKIHNKRELQQITINHSADIGYKDFMKIYRKCTNEPYFFSVSILRYLLIIFSDLEKIFRILLYKNGIN